jgi:hypothetical protein
MPETDEEGEYPQYKKDWPRDKWETGFSIPEPMRSGGDVAILDETSGQEEDQAQQHSFQPERKRNNIAGKDEIHGKEKEEKGPRPIGDLQAIRDFYFHRSYFLSRGWT